MGAGEMQNFRFQDGTRSKGVSYSDEVMEDVLEKLRKLGKRGDAVLEKINRQYQAAVGKDDEDEVINMGARHYSKPPVQYEDNIDRAKRRKRELILQTSIARIFNEDDVENDLGLEEVSHFQYFGLKL